MANVGKYTSPMDATGLMASDLCKATHPSNLDSPILKVVSPQMIHPRVVPSSTSSTSSWDSKSLMAIVLISNFFAFEILILISSHYSYPN